jgi:hypothetical protein
MFKRTLGYLLLTMLVLTGLAGRMHTDILSSKERRILVNELKTSRTAVLLSTSGLSKKQMNFRSGKNKPTIKELIYQLASIENSLRQMSREAMQANQNKKIKAGGDEDLGTIAHKVALDPNLLLIACTPFKNANEAISAYESASSELVRYARTTTENVRGHIVHTPAGNFDAYQLMLLTGKCTAYYIGEIEAIKKSHNFPK